MKEELYFRGKPLSELDLKGIAVASRSLRMAVPVPPTEDLDTQYCYSDCPYAEEGGARDAVVRSLRREDLYFMGKQLSELDLKEIKKASSLLVRALGAKTPEEYDCYECAGDAAYDDVRDAWDAVAITDSEAMEAVENAQFEKHFDPSSPASEEPFFNPFAPGFNCNPFAHLADPDRGVGK